MRDGLFDKKGKKEGDIQSLLGCATEHSNPHLPATPTQDQAWSSNFVGNLRLSHCLYRFIYFMSRFFLALSVSFLTLSMQLFLGVDLPRRDLRTELFAEPVMLWIRN